jgi:hypothetical protein
MRKRWRVLAGIVTLWVAACARRPPLRSTPPPAPQVALPGGLTVLLTWSTPVDLDLYLTDPSSETAYFANTPTRTGARLVRDARCRDIVGTAGPFVEVAQMAEPRPGRYRVGVDFIDACAAKPEPVSFRVVTEFGGMRREVTGTIRLEEFQPIVVEFTLQRLNSDGGLTLSQEGK